MQFRETQAIYLQIADYVCEKILIKEWKPNERIPSVRELAIQLEVNPNTVMRTYEFLQQQEIIYNQRGVGPFYMRSMVYTMPEFLERRYNSKSRFLLSIIQLLSYIIAKVSVTIYAGALVVTSFLGVDFWTGAIVLVIITGIYTVLAN